MAHVLPLLALLLAAPSAPPAKPPRSDGGVPTTAPEQRERAADVTPARLEDGSDNPDYYSPPASWRSTEGYQQLRWGMSLDEVRGVYPDVQEYAGTYGTKVTVGHRDMFAAFAFSRGRLASVVLVTLDEHASAHEYVADFKALREGLSTKYGQPTSDTTTWNSPVFKGDPERFAAALLLGHVTSEAQWRTKETSIRVTVSGNGRRVRSNVSYLSTRLARDLENEAKQAAAEGL